MPNVSCLLDAAHSGARQAAAAALLPLVYAELRKLAAAKLASEKPGQTLQATVLVHEAFLRLVGTGPPPGWNGRRHFFGAATGTPWCDSIASGLRKVWRRRPPPVHSAICLT
jgi:hypothetical protein